MGSQAQHSFLATAIELGLTPFLKEVFDPIGGMAAIVDV